jgi:preprotein translocase subunit SecD
MMEKKHTWRRIFVVLLTLFATAYALPTIVPAGSLPDWYSKVFSRTLHFGLDLQGGLELRYTVDYKRAIRDNTDRLRGTLVRRIGEEIATLEGLDASTLNKAQITEYTQGIRTNLIDFSTMEIVFDGESAVHKGILNQDFLDRYTVGYTMAGGGANQIRIQLLDTEVSRVRDSVVKETVSIIKRRVDAFGLVQPDVRKSGDTDIDVQLPGVGEDESDEIRKRLGQTAQLTFRMVDNSTNFFAGLQDKVTEYNAARPQSTVVYDTRVGAFRARSKAELVHFTKTRLMDADAIPDDHTIGYEFQDRSAGDTGSEAYWFTRYLFSRVELSGDYLTRAQVLNDPVEGWFVSLEFNGEGADIFGQLTTDNVGELMAIMLDSDVNSAPSIREPILGGRCRITMGGNRPPSEILRDSQSLVTVLNHGAYKAPVHKVHDHEVGPSLGADSIRSGSYALGIGAILVVFFMAFYYRMAGLIANLALFLNVILITAVLVNFGAAMTLPGMAGLILTIGMAVDANVLIFERIREELRVGRTPRAAVEAGYEKAFWTIFDANITTGLTGLILLNYTTGPIYGFAVVLLIGIICSVFTAYYVTRTVFDYILERSRVTELSI